MGNRCLYCYLPLDESYTDFHPKCSRKIFGTATVPELPYAEDELEPLARSVIASQTALTGVQPKLSLHLSSGKNSPKRFTIVGLWGGYILKPSSVNYPQLPGGRPYHASGCNSKNPDSAPFADTDAVRQSRLYHQKNRPYKKRQNPHGGYVSAHRKIDRG